jgi:hypothetical protein
MAFMIRKFAQEDMGEVGTGISNPSGLSPRDLPQDLEKDDRSFLLNQRPPTLRVFKKKKYMPYIPEGELLFSNQKKGDSVMEKEQIAKQLSEEEMAEIEDRFSLSCAFAVYMSGAKDFDKAYKELLLKMDTPYIDLSKAEKRAKEFYNDLKNRNKNERIEELTKKELFDNEGVNLVHFTNFYKEDGKISVGITDEKYEQLLKEKYFNLPLAFEVVGKMKALSFLWSGFRSFKDLNLQND